MSRSFPNYSLAALFMVLSLAFLAGQPAIAQTAKPTPKARPAYVLGLRGGGNLSLISGNELHYGFHAGAFADMHPSRNYGYSLELNYARQGGTFRNLPIITTYAVVPVLFNLYVSEVALQGGLYAAPLLAARTRYLTYYDISGGMNNMDLGLAFGIKKALGTFGIGVRYYHGLQNVAGSGEKETNRKLEVSVRLNF